MQPNPPQDDFGMREHFDPEHFSRIGHAVIDLVAAHLSDTRTSARDKVTVLHAKTPDEMVALFPADFDTPRDPVAFVREMIDWANHLHHPRYIGHQVSSPLPVAALLDFLSAFLNNGSAIYEMGPASIAMERNLLRWLGGRLGFDAGCDGVFTSGGSAGNLTALLAARQAKAGFDIWSDGNSGGEPLAVLVADQAHYSVQRAVQILGWGSGGVVTVPTDSQFRLDARALPACLIAARKAGRKVIAVVASAGSSATGAIDPLADIAAFCEKEGLWLHVDGAHGASLSLSGALKKSLIGIERADSVVWDAHKMMLTPALLTAVIFRDGRKSYEAFAQEASYLYQDGGPSNAWYDAGMRTLECTKRMMGMVLYGTLAIHSVQAIAAYIESRVALTRWFAGQLAQSADFQLATFPDCNILCFRYLPRDGHSPDALQGRLREKIVKSGKYYIVQTRLRGSLYLRLTIINPQTNEEDLLALLAECRLQGAEGSPSSP